VSSWLGRRLRQRAAENVVNHESWHNTRAATRSTGWTGRGPYALILTAYESAQTPSLALPGSLSRVTVSRDYGDIFGGRRTSLLDPYLVPRLGDPVLPARTVSGAEGWNEKPKRGRRRDSPQCRPIESRSAIPAAQSHYVDEAPNERVGEGGSCMCQSGCSTLH
jgi:hypothetical protein